MLASFATLRTRASDKLLVGVYLFTSSNMEPAHNTTKYFAPTYNEVVNLTGLL
jgi:hypothetical protein